MKIKFKELSVITEKVVQVINITQIVEKYVEECGIKEGFIHIMTKHTTTSLWVNEGLPCVEEDILNYLEKIVPENGDYIHDHFLRNYGTLGCNTNSHVKSVLMGYFLYFPIHKGKLVKGQNQTLYFSELDGPHKRGWTMQVIGE